MTNESSFETYWAEREAVFKKSQFQDWFTESMREEAEKSWNHARSYEHEQILEANVIINKGIWTSMMDRIKK